MHRLRLAALGVALALSGCAAGLQVTTLPHADSDACHLAAAHWPLTVGGNGQVTVRVQGQASDSVRAWGDPPVIARCGAEPLPPTTDPCVSVDGVDWVGVELSDGRRFTTYGRSPALEVLVPSVYDPAALLLPAFGPMASALPATGARCL